MILLERRKELLMRGLRWMDIKRLNKENRNLVLKRIAGSQVFMLLPNDKYYALPLPTDIILNSNLQQN
jgi:starch-binding outer membrane protein, SusD/RagB family